MMAIEMLGNARLLWAGRFAAVFAASIAAAGEASATDTILYNFAGGTSDGANPYAGVTLDSSGSNLYGATYAGGANGYGTVFKVPVTGGSDTVLYNLPGGIGGINGAGPAGTPVLDNSGNIYGTAAYNTISGSGVGSGGGVVYKLTPSGSNYNYSVLHTFAGGVGDGANPFAGLIYDNSNYLYGTTVAGGSSNYGTVFKESISGGTPTISSFNGSTGHYPWAGVIFDSTGSTLYGTTVEGGSSSDGVVYSLSTSGGTPTVLYNFPGGSNGELPYGGLFLGASNVLFGTTWFGGNAASDGLVFRLIPNGVGSSYLYNVMHTFAGGSSDGANPYASPVRDPNTGNVYGTTNSGGAYGYGVVYKLTPSGTTYTETILHSFAGGTGDGANPYAALVFDSTHTHLYGTTLNGGTSGKGVVFEVTP